jgi:TolB-like protein/tetratricopeptide (TPR) repeat protein
MVESERRLAAIMFTDMVGYTSLAQRDEALSLVLVDEQRKLIRPMLAKHGGREVKTIGDAFLVEFGSARDAVNCAAEIQKAIKERNLTAPREQEIKLRIGIHLGDVVHQGTDVAGDAVNVASRIEPISPSGGVCVSAQVFHSVVNKVDCEFESLGVPELKNVSVPIELYRIIGLGDPTPKPASKNVLPKERVAVLPLSNFSPDPNDEYFADGMTEELIDRLAQVKGLRVIARTSVMGYKKKERKVSEIGRELGVGTLVEGSVRKAGSRVRITVQLIDVATEEHIWSNRYDKELDDVFAIQTEIASRITGQIESSIPGIAPMQPAGPQPPEKAARHTADMEAYTAYLRGRKLFNEKRSIVEIKQALALFEEAGRKDPSFSRAKVGIAEALLYLATEGAANFAESENRARRELTEALSLDSGLAEAHSVLAGLMLSQDDMAGSGRESRRAIELNPSLSDPYRWLAQIVAGEGKIDEAVRLLESAQAVDPLDINVIAFLGRAYAYAGREADALAHWERTKPLVTYRTNAHMSEYYLGKGDYARASETVAEMERLGPERSWTLVYRGILAARTGDKETALRMLGLLRKKAERGELTEFFQGFIHFALGDTDAFVKCMEKVFELHNLPLLELMYSPIYAPARKDPRIADLLRRQAALRSTKK